MASIYNIPNWSGGITASENDVYFYASKHFYSLENSNTETPGIGAVKWGGYTNHNGSEKPRFFWKPSYNLNLAKSPKVRSIQFGDGYEQRINDGVSHNLNVINMVFEQRDEKESAAILHFLEVREGSESFVFTPPPPYNKSSLYLCRDWDSSYTFYNNYTIKCQFEEVVD